VDGAYAHEAGDNPARDASRQAYLEGEGLRVLRLAAADVLRDPDGAADAIIVAASRG
jgi:very-short-patch-repair endonuclease